MNAAAAVLPDSLHTLLSDSARPDAECIAAARRWLDTINAPAWIADLSDHVSRDEQLAVHIGGQSVTHPNGFDLLTLTGGLPAPDRLPTYRLRLHIWWQQHVIEDVHNHAWDFCSRVLTGALRFSTYQHATPDDRPAQVFYRYRYHFGSDGDFSDQPIERVHLARGLDAILATATTYSFRHDQLHRVAPSPGSVVATLVVTGRFRTNGSDIYTDRPRHTHGARLPAAPLGPQALIDRMSRLAHILNGAAE